MGMIIERIKSEGIAQLSYLLGSETEAVVIDPRRDCQIYIDHSQGTEMNIKYIVETHRNEDFVSGSMELAHLTDAKIYHGSGLDFKYGEPLEDGQEFVFGKMKVITLHTPGHTDESMSYVLTDLALGDAPVMVFTGDALFVGDVGRIDFGGPDKAHKMAENLYNSIFNKLLPLGDSVLIGPAHGSGSICGIGISKREDSTIGLERLYNPVLQKRNKEEFIQYKVAEHHEYIPYFRKMEEYNLNGPPLLEHLPIPRPLLPHNFQDEMRKGAVIVDTRNPSDFGAAHIKGSYSIVLKALPSFAGWVLTYDKPTLLVVEDRTHIDQAVRSLIRLGFDQIAGYLFRGVEAWYNKALPTDHLGLLTVHDLKKQLDLEDELVILDVRGDHEWKHDHIDGAIHIYVGHLERNLNNIPSDKPIVVVCGVGERASLGASILQREGFQHVSNLLGGITAWKNANYPVIK